MFTPRFGYHLYNSHNRTWWWVLIIYVIFIISQSLLPHINITNKKRTTPKPEFVWLGELSKSCSFTGLKSYWLIPSCQQWPAGSVIKVIGKQLVSTANYGQTQNRLTAARVVPLTHHDSSLLFWFSDLSQTMVSWRGRIAASFWVWLGRNEGSLLFSFVFGGTQLLEENTQRIVKEVGLSHMVAASGLQIGLMGYIISTLPGLGRIWLKRGLQIIVIWIYAWTALFSASILRAATMASFAYLAMIWGRKSASWWYLALAVMILCLVAPILILSPGFQLSVMASLGLILQSSSPISQMMVGVGPDVQTTPDQTSIFTRVKNYLRETGQLSIVAQIWTLPLVMYHFGQVSIWSVVSTTLVSWLAAPLFNWGLLMAVLAIFTSGKPELQPLLIALSTPPQLLTQIFLKIALVLHQTSTWTLGLQQLPIWCIVVWYAGLFWWHQRRHRRAKRLSTMDVIREYV